MPQRLTKRILEAICQASDYIEAGGVDEVQGYEGDEADRMFEAIVDAGIWARQQLNKREAKASLKQGKGHKS